MPEAKASDMSFEELWQRVTDNPIQQIDSGEDDQLRAPDALVAWLRQIADACRADGLIAEADHAELQTCNDAYARVLGAVPAEKFRAILTALGDPET